MIQQAYADTLRAIVRTIGAHSAQDKRTVLEIVRETLGVPVECEKKATDCLLSIKEVAARLSCCNRTVLNYVRSGELRAVYVGSKIRGIPASEIDAFLARAISNKASA